MSEVGNRNTCGQASPSSPTLHSSPAVLQSWAPRRVSAYQTCEAISKQRRTLSLQVLSDGHVYFTNEGKQRPSADAALEHPFLAPAFNPDLTPEELAEGTTSTGSRNWLASSLSFRTASRISRTRSARRCGCSPRPCSVENQARLSLL